jgi:hypothetical protein
MRRVLTRAGFLIVVVLSAAFYMQWTKFTAESAPIPIYCEAAAPEGIDPPLAQLANLIAGDGAADDEFGRSVAVSGDTLVVGARSDDIGANGNQGSAYVFVRSGGVWSLQQKLTANDGEASDLFGSSVAISGDTVVIGAPHGGTATNPDQGAAYVFVRSGAVWSFQQKLIAQDGADIDLFGISVAIHGDTALVGAHADDIGAAENQGSAYLFSRSGSTWTQRQKLRAQEGAVDDFFGQAIALGDDEIIVGAPAADTGANANQGAIYIFGCGYVERQRLPGAGGADSDFFGNAVRVNIR